jgi:hypothetical protein
MPAALRRAAIARSASQPSHSANRVATNHHADMSDD